MIVSWTCSVSLSRVMFGNFDGAQDKKVGKAVKHLDSEGAGYL